MVRESCGVGVVFFNLEIRLVVEQSIEYVRGVSYGRVDHLGVKRRLLVGYVGVEEHSRFGAVTAGGKSRVLECGPWAETASSAALLKFGI